MSTGMSYNLDQEQFEIIGEAIKDNLSNRKGIFSFLKKRGQVIDLEDEIYIHDFRYSRDLEDGEIGIKYLPFYKSGIKIRRVALIKIVLKIDEGLLDRWENNGRQGIVLHDLNIYSYIKRFLDQIEQFILRGTDTKLEFAVNDIGVDEVFNCFFHGHQKRDPINIHEFKNLHEAVVNLKYELRKEHYNPPFTLISDSETLKWAEYKYFQTIDGNESYKDKVIELNEINKWIDLHGNADNSNGDDYSLICIANKELFNTPINIIEKSPLNLFNFHSGIVLYWCGALETSENAIQQVRINNFNK